MSSLVTDPPAGEMTGTSDATDLLRRLVSVSTHRDVSPQELSDVGLDELARAASRHGVLGLAVRRMDELRPHLGPARVRADMLSALRVTELRQMPIEHTTQNVIETLASRGVRAMPLKGPRLSRRIYGDAAVRASTDVDVLVSRADLPAAVRHVQARGWGRSTDLHGRDDLPRVHDALQPGTPDLPTVEIHWRLHWYEERFAERMLAEAHEEDGFLVAAPEHELMALLLYFARDGLSGLRFPADIAAWWDRYGERVDAGAVQATLARHPELAPAARVTAAVAERLVGAPIAELYGHGRWTRRMTQAGRAADWRTDGDQRDRILLVDGLLTPWASIGSFLARHIVPPARAMRRAYAIPPGPRGIPQLLLRRATHLRATAWRLLRVGWSTRR